VGVEELLSLGPWAVSATTPEDTDETAAAYLSLPVSLLVGQVLP
jgi:hypothetical protein